MISRRGFLKLFAAAPVTYFLPPPRGWVRTDGGLLMNSATPGLWVSKTPEGIMADIEALLVGTWCFNPKTPATWLFVSPRPVTLSMPEYRLLRTRGIIK